MVTQRLSASFLLMVCLNAQSAAAAPELDLMPWPQSVATAQQGQSLTLTSAPQIRVEGPGGSPIQLAGERFLRQLQRQTSLAQQEPATTIEIAIAGRADSALSTDSEAYTLDVRAQQITLKAATTRGAMHGLQTLLQLIESEGEGAATVPAVSIRDFPRFAWRGLLLDSVRHFFSVETIKRQVDGMAAAKLNVLHWHLTDDQGWRLESEAYPRLHQANSDGFYYSRAEVQDIVRYARERGIHVMPEIDMPGHASAIAVAYPELMSAPGPYRPEDRWGVHKPLLNPAEPAVYKFAQKILGEVAELFPFPYVHIGGDEVDPEHWENNAAIQTFMAEHELADEQQLHAYFNGRLASILQQLNRHMVGWDEVLHPDLPKDTVVQSWRGPDALAKAIDRGHPALLSTGFYLDQPQYAGYHYRVNLLPQPLSINTTPAASESWQSWTFSAPRKRGSDIHGVLTIIDAQKPRGFIDFKGKTRQAVTNLEKDNGEISFTIDSWMGPITASLNYDASSLTGQLRVGNAPYQLTGTLTAGSNIEGSHPPEALEKPVIEQADLELLLGGEAALWSELIDENSIDLRLWPRGFVVAERLWSDALLRNEAFMLQRLDSTSRWAATSVGLEHDAQQRQALENLYPSIPLPVLYMFSSAMEPAHYYHRHHEKSQRESYSRRDPLNRFVDSLPAQSRRAQVFAQTATLLTASPDNSELQQAVREQLQQWQQAAKAVKANSHESQHVQIHALSDTLERVTHWGLAALQARETGEPLSEQQRQQAEAALNKATTIQHETIVAAAFGIETLLAE